MIGLGKAIAVAMGVTLLAGCATVEMPWNADVDKEVVGKIKLVEKIELIIPGGGVDVAFADGGIFQIEPDGRPGELVTFYGNIRECPTDPPGEMRYLVHLAWGDGSNGKKRLWMTGCTPINPEASFGF